MSLPHRDGQLSFFDVPALTEGLFGPDDRYRLFHQKILPALEQARATLAQMYCADNGREAIEPLILAGVTLLQFMEKVPDRKAVEQVRLHLGWKYALGLEVHYEGFDPTTLVHFRNRLLDNDAARVVFDAILSALGTAGRVKLHRRSKERLDSTHVLGCVARMSRLQMVRETLRLVLEMIERHGYSCRLESWALWIERYRDSEIDWRRQTTEQLQAKFRQAGVDALALIKWLRRRPASLRDHDHSLLLQRVFLEQFDLAGDGPTPQRHEPAGCVKNPHDPEAQWAAKDQAKTKTWTGYKVQVVETVDAEGRTKDKGEPTEQFITEVTTTEAIASDLDGMERARQAQRDHGQDRPDELFVDAAYVSGQTLAQAQAEGMELVGPARPAVAHKGVFDSDQFDVDLAARKAVCPAGRRSTQCSLINDTYQDAIYYRFEWGRQCDECPLQSACTRSKSGRRILSVGIHHDLVQRRRREMKAPGFRERMHQRNGIEGTISELARAGMRRTRYKGLAKTRLGNHMLGAGCNVKRWLRRLAWEWKNAEIAA